MESLPRNSFAWRLSKALEDAGIPDDRSRRSTLAQMFRVSPESVRKWLKGLSIPETEKIVQIARKLKVNGEWLLTGLGPQSGEHIPALVARTTRQHETVTVPLLDVRASAGDGIALHDQEEVLDSIRLSEDWCRRHLTISNPSNLATLVAYGDSMKPTFHDGDILLIDRGINELKIDAIYVLQLRNQLYVKRVQRRMEDGFVVIKSDNALYDPYVVDPAKNHMQILGRVVWSWSGNKH